MQESPMESLMVSVILFHPRLPIFLALWRWKTSVLFFTGHTHIHTKIDLDTWRRVWSFFMAHFRPIQSGRCQRRSRSVLLSPHRDPDLCIGEFQKGKPCLDKRQRMLQFDFFRFSSLSFFFLNNDQRKKEAEKRLDVCSFLILSLAEIGDRGLSRNLTSPNKWEREMSQLRVYCASCLLIPTVWHQLGGSGGDGVNSKWWTSSLVVLVDDLEEGK